jgi:hypothetical protein
MARIMVDELVSYPQQAQPGARHVFGSGRRSCHLMVDGPIEALHAFAARLGLKREWLHADPAGSDISSHYDLTPGKRALAVKIGAEEVSGREQARMRRAKRAARRAADGAP